MLDISELDKESKITELLNDIERKFNTFSIGNTLFPKNKISESELIIFFESIIENINEIAYSPAIIRNTINNGELISEQSTAISLYGANINSLIDCVKKNIDSESAISFYDVSRDIQTNRYCCRLFIYDDPIKMKVKNRDNKINQVLNEQDI